MRKELTRRQSLSLVGASALALGAGGRALGGRLTRLDCPNGAVRRVATTVAGAEFTGLFLTDDGTLFCNVAHPDGGNAPPYDRGGIGVFEGVDVRSLPTDFDSLPPTWTSIGRRTFRTKFGTHRVLANGGDPTTTGERLGITTDPTGAELTDGSKPDFNGFVPLPGSESEGHLFTAWEHIPGAVSRLELRRDGGGVDGPWSVVRSENLDLRPVDGIWNPCFGTVSPWGTPLLSEEYEPDAGQWARGVSYKNSHQLVNRYLGREGNPYRYGWIVEVTAPLAPTPRFVRRFAMGRFSHENAVVMPDRRTVYLTDDGTASVLFKFVADRPGDLASGMLYAAKLTQDEERDPGRAGFDVSWVELAHGREADVARWVAEYDRRPTASRYIGRGEIAAWARGDASDDRVAFLESRRAAQAAGATAEWHKLEGVNVRPGAEPGDFLFLAVSSVRGTMLGNEVAGAYATPRDDVRLQEVEQGALYCAELDGSFDVARIDPAVVGSRKTFWGPDNVVVLPDGRVLIGEDGPHHPNELWLFDPAHE
ncbi:alkaline phosphatase PhoX [Haloarchaeobius sp. TZWWS8]|uniref:alkaline phosphatase PhoX n=1 Tax=Haloarchaeobius sp. TZWWS8 TaxID=3446121 RepID=UPI003EBCF219